MATADGFYFVHWTVRAIVRPDIMRMFHVDMFHGWDNWLASFDGPRDASNTLEIHKNLYNITELFCPGGHLVISQRLPEVLEPHIKAEFFPVRFRTPFCYPYELGKFPPFDGDYEVNANWERAMAELAERHRCDPPAGNYYEMLLYGATELASQYGDVTKRTLGLEAKDFIIEKEGVLVSPTMIEEYGMVRSDGLLMTDEVYKLLEPYITLPYFWVWRYTFVEAPC